MEAVLQARQQQPVAHILEPLPTAFAAALTAKHTESRTHIDLRGLGKLPLFSDREEDFYGLAKKLENTVWQVCADTYVQRCSVQRSLKRKLAWRRVPSKYASWTDATLAEIDAQLFVVLSSLRDGESFDIVTSSGGDRGDESWRRLPKRCAPRNGRTCTQSLERNPVTATRKAAQN